MLLSCDRKQALKCIDAEGDVQAAERAMLALHVKDVPPPPDLQQLPDEEDDVTPRRSFSNEPDGHGDPRRCVDGREILALTHCWSC